MEFKDGSRRSPSPSDFAMRNHDEKRPGLTSQLQDTGQSATPTDLSHTTSQNTPDARTFAHDRFLLPTDRAQAARDKIEAEAIERSTNRTSDDYQTLTAIREDGRIKDFIRYSAKLSDQTSPNPEEQINMNKWFDFNTAAQEREEGYIDHQALHSQQADIPFTDESNIDPLLHSHPDNTAFTSQVDTPPFPDSGLIPADDPPSYESVIQNQGKHTIEHPHLPNHPQETHYPFPNQFYEGESPFPPEGYQDTNQAETTIYKIETPYSTIRSQEQQGSHTQLEKDTGTTRKTRNKDAARRSRQKQKDLQSQRIKHIELLLLSQENPSLMSSKQQQELQAMNEAWHEKSAEWQKEQRESHTHLKKDTGTTRKERNKDAARKVRQKQKDLQLRYIRHIELLLLRQENPSLMSSEQQQELQAMNRGPDIFVPQNPR